jgi:hypothetical protein
MGLLDRIDRAFFQSGEDGNGPAAMPMAGRKLQVNTDWGRE